MEVEREADAEQAGGTEGHVGVAGEIEVELERIGDRADPGFGHRRVAPVGGGEAEDRGGDAGEVVGDHHLLEQAAEEDPERDREVAVPAVMALAELRHHLAVMDQRPGDQVGEEGDEEQVVGEVILLGLAAVGIDEVGDLEEGEEGDREGEDDLGHGRRPAGE